VDRVECGSDGWIVPRFMMGDEPLLVTQTVDDGSNTLETVERLASKTGQHDPTQAMACKVGGKPRIAGGCHDLVCTFGTNPAVGGCAHGTVRERNVPGHIRPGRVFCVRYCDSGPARQPALIGAAIAYADIGFPACDIDPRVGGKEFGRPNRVFQPTQCARKKARRPHAGGNPDAWRARASGETGEAAFEPHEITGNFHQSAPTRGQGEPSGAAEKEAGLQASLKRCDTP